MKVFLEYTEIITTIIANLVIIPSTIWAVYRFLANRKNYIELDNGMNLITKQNEIKEIIRDLIIEPAKIKSLDIIIKSKKGKNKTIEDAAWNKKQELNLLCKQKIIKRGLHLLVLFPQYSGVDMSIPGVLDEMFISFIEMYKNMNNRESDGIALRLDVFTKVDKWTVRTILYLNAKEKEELFKLKGFTDAGQILPTMVAFSELQKIKSDFLRQTILGLMLGCAVSDQLWIGDKISNEKELIKIFYPIYWEIGLS